MSYGAIIYMELEGMDFESIGDNMEQAIEEGMRELAEEIEWEWRHQAASKLNESKEKYLQGLSVEVIGRDIEVHLSGPIPVGLETGMPSFDLKPGFLKGGKPYRIIPMGFPPANPVNPRFRIVTPTSKGWIHPGFSENPGMNPNTGKSYYKAGSITETVQSKVEEGLIPEIFDRVLGNVKI